MSYLQDAIETSETKDWIEEARNRSDSIFLIVGKQAGERKSAAPSTSSARSSDATPGEQLLGLEYMELNFTQPTRPFPNNLQSVTFDILEGQGDGTKVTIQQSVEDTEVLRHVKEVLTKTPKLERGYADVCFQVDLSGFFNVKDAKIDSCVTITALTSESGATFANTAKSYVSWRWGNNGVEILHWLPKLFSGAPPQTIHIKQGSREMCIELHSQHPNAPAAAADKPNASMRIKWISGTFEEYCILVADVALELAWVMSAFEGVKQEGLLFSEADIVHQPSGSLGDDQSSNFHIARRDSVSQCAQSEYNCWQMLFRGISVAVGFNIPLRPPGMEGLELPLPLMTTLTGIDHKYPVLYGPGYILKGPKNALIPVNNTLYHDGDTKSACLQWHLLRTRLSRLYMEEWEEKNPEILPSVSNVDEPKTDFVSFIEKTERHFLGLYRTAEISTGTWRTRQPQVLSANGLAEIEHRDLKPCVWWNRTLNIAFGGGAGGPSGGASTGFYFPSKTQRQFILDQNTTKNFEDYVEETRTRLAILYDAENRVAWMLPRICVVLYLIQASLSTRQGHNDVRYPIFEQIQEPESVLKAMRKFIQQEAAENFGLEDRFSQFSHAFTQLEDNSYLRPETGTIPNSLVLAGIDFVRLAERPNTYSILQTKIHKDSGGIWPAAVKRSWNAWKSDPHPLKVVALFCRNTHPNPIIPADQFCEAWRSPPPRQDYMVTTTYCISLLAETHGGDPVKLSPGHAWVIGEKGPFDLCQGPSSNRNLLQKIEVGHIRLPRYLRRELAKVPTHAAVIFGKSCVSLPQCECHRQNSSSADRVSNDGANGDITSEAVGVKTAESRSTSS
ncbi:hypothetical protein MGU_07381 [Metarhizium guizhouense ARSEF 977]|uniref:Uncharacterized protein n=1 Tax=Metarhizium guizhouense (strain ARSEF 977) TaxID=1276136 RepID=A0A0B4I049_METGA|nr:hypothetical protein MGU_07381 [Metarhizium guizhouense ARSEF 977]